MTDRAPSVTTGPFVAPADVLPELTEEDLDLLRRFGAGEWCVFKVALPDGRLVTR